MFCFKSLFVFTVSFSISNLLLQFTLGFFFSELFKPKRLIDILYLIDKYNNQLNLTNNFMPFMKPSFGFIKGCYNFILGQMLSC